MNPEDRATNPTPVSAVKDGWARAIGIPGFGLLIPHLTGLFGELGPRELMFWVGTAWFVLLAAVIWQGNLWLLYLQRRHVDWFSRPFYKIVALVFACTFYTAPVTVLMLLAWYAMAAMPVDIGVVVVVSLTNVICVLFVTHAYETAFLIKGRTIDTVQMSDLQRAVTAAQLDALQRQVDPHFLFNCLNVLGALIESDPKSAARFNDALAEVYRYLLDERDLVTLDEELDFVRAYGTLMQLRFGDALEVRVPEERPRTARVPPTSVQTLVENAVKHTGFDLENPLTVSLFVDDKCVRVENLKRPRQRARPSSGLGLKNLDERCRLLIGRGLFVDDGEQRFSVSVPLLLEVTP